MQSKTFGYKPFSYFISTFFTTWLFWHLASGFSKSGNSGLMLVCLLVGLAMPFLVALKMVFSGTAEIKKQFFNKLLNLRLIHLGTLPAIFLMPIASILIAITISLFMGFSAEQFTLSHSFSFSVGIPTLLMLFLAASLEELGWRGYGMESLGRFNYFNASLIFGILWSLWHLPLFIIPSSYQYEILQQNGWYAINFIVGIIPLAFIVSWVCKKNSGSIIAAILFHFIINITQELFMVAPQTKCIQTGVLAVFALVLVVWDRKLFFDKP